MVNANLVVPNSSEEEAFRRILAHHFKRYPLMEVQDIYKLIHQASMGSEHAVQDLDITRAFLEREVNELADGPEEPIEDIISANGQISRINLRPYLASNASLENLFEAFVRTANEFEGSTIKLKRYHSYAERLKDESSFAFSPSAIRTFFDRMEDQGFPAVHHSASYAAAYQPAYRVVLHELLDTP
ncbi:MAG: hypothetical protein E3J69_12555 [Anaerolineales bacterium]|nr:MAG: hypothetical protein E3J69_12555 [Anaerolineales bacterium]